MRFEELLHDTIDEMTGELTGPPPGLAGRSIAKGRRIRRTRRLAAGAGAVLAFVAVALPWVILSRPGAQPVPGERPSPDVQLSAGAPRLPGGWVVTGAGTSVLDRTTGRYVPLEGGRTVLPAPVGNRVLIAGPESVQVTDVRGTNPVPVNAEGLGGAYSWDATGTRLLDRVTQKDPFKIGFAVIDAMTGAVRKHWVDTARYDCSRCTFTWARDGDVIMAIADRSGGEALEKVERLQVFDAGTGEPQNALLATAMPTGAYSWSPGGRYLVGDADGTGKNWQLIDTTTGQSRSLPYDAVWVSADELLAVQDGKVFVLTPDGTVTATIDAPLPGPGPISLGPPG